MITVRERPKAIKLTDRAADRIHAIMEKSDAPIYGVKLGVKNAGCAGMAYTLDYAAEAGPHDEVVEDKGVRVLIDPMAIMFLLGTEMDWEEDKMQAGFTFKNPNVIDACGCGESVKFAGM